MLLFGIGRKSVNSNLISCSLIIILLFGILGTIGSIYQGVLGLYRDLGGLIFGVCISIWIITNDATEKVSRLNYVFLTLCILMIIDGVVILFTVRYYTC